MYHYFTVKTLPLEYKIIKGTLPGLQALEAEIARGGRFLLFPYCISLGAVSLKRMSPAIFVPAEADPAPHRRKYNLLSCLFGWWGVPWGPLRTIACIRTNNSGGIDVTGDIMLNIDAAAFDRGFVNLRHSYTIFEKPDTADQKAFLKAMAKLPAGSGLRQLVAGLYLDTEDGVAPYYIIGVDSDDLFENHRATLTRLLRTQFYRHVRFEFIALEAGNTLAMRLREQGAVIYSTAHSTGQEPQRS